MKLGRLALVPAGEFMMGTTDIHTGPGEDVREVFVGTAAVATTPITNHQFQAFADEHGGDFSEWKVYATPDRNTHPAVCLSWADAMQYCTWLSDQTGIPHSLPTDMVWEKAARGKLKQKLFPWGDELPTEKHMCWNRWSMEIGTTPVETFPANGYGIFDMAGNVWEWCQNGPESPEYRFRRGGAWNIGEPFRARCGNIGMLFPHQRYPNMGARVCIPFEELSSEKRIEIAIHCVSQRVTTDGGVLQILSFTKNTLTLSMKGTCLICPKKAHSQEAVRTDLLAALPELQTIRFI